MPGSRRFLERAVHSGGGSLELASGCSPAWPQVGCVLIADAVPLFRDGLARLAEASCSGVRVIQSGSIGDIWRLAAQDRLPDLFLVDLGLLGLELGFELARLRKCYRSASIIAMAHDADAATITAAMRSGCNGFIHKGLPREQCAWAIGRVLAGFCVVEHSEADPADSRQIQIDNKSALTARQSAVLGLLAEGASNKAIARELGISHLTVRLHVSSLLRIFAVNRRTEVAPKARILGMLTPA
ncbi:response regulator transcription factor [Porphyrobacter sp. CACIAM 03H1]|uniref:response regulator transcription factor n=1 Tax=Porphyrobacter sp. CACIAM 03H1 TaxID=2003315 RepID=UPI000B5AA970|nr:response regulator transcription factor [Porphyrobacter sp. CACIAM 03H1]ASJ91934.1 DNA-binding response regulator [Porphyrobacter sp. CACIAM 03H1]